MFLFIEREKHNVVYTCALAFSYAASSYTTHFSSVHSYVSTLPLLLSPNSPSFIRASPFSVLQPARRVTVSDCHPVLSLPLQSFFVMTSFL